MLFYEPEIRNFVFSQYVMLRCTYKKDFLKRLKCTEAEILFWVELDDKKDINNNFFAMVFYEPEIRNFVFSQYVMLRRTYKKDFLKRFKCTDAEISFWVALDDQKDITNNFIAMVFHTQEIWNFAFPQYVTLPRTYRKDFLQIFMLANAYILFWVTLDDREDITNNFFCYGSE